MKNISSDKILYSKGNNDELYTPEYGVEPILKYIPANAVVWCPFDKEQSEFVKLISKKNKVIHTHLDNNEDFLSYEPDEEWDIIVSNPPFTNKRWENPPMFPKEICQSLLYIVGKQTLRASVYQRRERGHTGHSARLTDA